jgi:hypothetical protein
MATTLTNTLQGWRDYARIMKQSLDSEVIRGKRWAHVGGVL